MDKRGLSERDICTKYITPAIERGGWDVQTQVRENVHLIKGRVIVRGKLVARGEQLKQLMSVCDQLEERLGIREASARALGKAIAAATRSAA